MADRLRFFTLDVFTDTPFAGNPLAVVLEADDLSETQMLALAREFNLSETIFVLAPEHDGTTARVRIFTPAGEIPFAGHPTLGCAVLLAELSNPAAEFDAEIVLEEEAGLVPVKLARRDGITRGNFVAPVLPYRLDDEGAITAEMAALALGLPLEAIGFADHEVTICEGGPAFVFVPVMDRFELASAGPVEPYWSQLTEAAGVGAVYLYTPGRKADYQARMFAPAEGIPEDPATGSASAILAAQLLDAGALPRGKAHLHLVQGVEMERPSQIGLHTLVEEGELAEVRISGAAVQVGEGTIIVPPDSPS